MGEEKDVEGDIPGDDIIGQITISIKEVKCGRAGGPGNIPAEFINYGRKVVQLRIQNMMYYYALKNIQHQNN